MKIIAFVSDWIDEKKESGLKIEYLAAEWRRYLGHSRSKERRNLYTQAIDPSPLEGFEDILDEDIQSDDFKMPGSLVSGTREELAADSIFQCRNSSSQSRTRSGLQRPETNLR